MPNNIEKLLTVACNEVQAVEDAAQQLLARSIFTSTGFVLDQIGDIVGRERNGLSDDDYRRYLFAQIATNRSQGRREDMIRIAKLVINDTSATMQVDNQGIAAFVLRVLEVVPVAAAADALSAMLSVAAKAGIRAILETLTADDDHTFTLAIAGFANGPLSIGDTSIVLAAVSPTTGRPTDTSLFPSSGSVDIDVGLATAETVTYSGKSGTTLLGCSALTQNHVVSCPIVVHGSLGLGFDNGHSPGSGGQFADARD